MLLFYLLIVTFAILIAYAGYEETMRLVSYLDLLIKYQIIKVRMYFMRRRLRHTLNLDHIQLIKDRNHGPQTREERVP